MSRKKIAFTAVIAAVAAALTGGSAASAEPGPAGLRAVQDQIRELAVAPTDESKLGDMTGDGKADLLAVDNQGRLWIYPGKAVVYSGTGARPTSFFGKRIPAGTGWQNFQHIVRHGDWNNDGKQDILAVTDRGWLQFYAGTGNPARPIENALTFGNGWDEFLNLVGIGDGNGDGFDDLIARKDGVLVKYEGTGKAYPPFRKNPSSSGSGWNGSHLTTVGDWTGDGRSEFVFLNSRQELWLYRGRPGSGLPANSPQKLADSSFGNGIHNLVGMGNLTSDASAAAVLPDLVFTDNVRGGLWAIAPDTGESFTGSLGSGWAGYRIF